MAWWSLSEPLLIQPTHSSSKFDSLHFPNFLELSGIIENRAITETNGLDSLLASWLSPFIHSYLIQKMRVNNCQPCIIKGAPYLLILQPQLAPASASHLLKKESYCCKSIKSRLLWILQPLISTELWSDNLADRWSARIASNDQWRHVKPFLSLCRLSY